METALAMNALKLDGNDELNNGKKFNFGFHVGFDLYISSRCGEAVALTDLESMHEANDFAAGYLAMALTRSEHSSVPRNKTRARELSVKVFPRLLRVIKLNQSGYLADAHYIVGFCYHEGFGTFKNIKEAVWHYSQSSLLGHPGASVNLSNCYDDGEGVEQDRHKVFALDSSAADVGHPIAINNLACCYLYGKGVNVNHTMKMKLWERASEIGYSMSQVNLGLTFLQGVHIKRDAKKAFKLFQTAAGLGLSRAQYMLSYCYYNGIGTDGDMNKAMEYCRDAALQGNCNAQYFLANMLYISDPEEALKYLKLSAEGGYDDAQYRVACSFRDSSDMTPQDIIESVRWMKKASTQGHEKAQNELSSLRGHYIDALWFNRRSFWMFLAACHFLNPPTTDASFGTDCVHSLFYITDLCIYISTFI